MHARARRPALNPRTHVDACLVAGNAHPRCRFSFAGSVPTLIPTHAVLRHVPRQLMHHSVLSSAHHDGLILGASSLEHLNANLAACAKGPLPEPVVGAYDAAWACARPVADVYFRGYGTRAGGADSFLKMHQEVVPASDV